MTPRWFIAAGVVVALGCSSFAQAQTRDQTSANDAFVRDAIQIDLAEIDVGKLAQQKGANEKVKQYGEKLVTDHTANLEKAKTLAQSMKVSAPTQPNAMQKEMYDNLSKLSGAQFDRDFSNHMVEGHEMAIRMFQQASDKTGSVADFAKQSLPTLRQHLEIAQSLTGASP